MKKINLLSIIFTFIVVYSCTEKMDIDLPEGYTKLMVNGMITDEAKVHKVKLTKTANYFSNKQTPPVSNAKVSVSDGVDTYILNESKNEPGVYETTPTFKGVEGRTYFLHIKDVDINDDGKPEEYEASSELKHVNQIDSVDLKFTKFGEFKAWEVMCYAWDSPKTDFYVFKALINGKLVKDTLTEWQITDDVVYNGNYTNGITCQMLFEFEKPDEVLKTGDTVTLEINGVTEDYYQFLWDTMNESWGQNPLFSGPPANIRTNLSEGAVGFFTAYSVRKGSKIVTPDVMKRKTGK